MFAGGLLANHPFRGDPAELVVQGQILTPTDVAISPMVPVIVHEIGQWLDQFSYNLDRWEGLLSDLRGAYVRGDVDCVKELCRLGQDVQRAVVEDKEARQEILGLARERGYQASNLRDLSTQLDGQWPALWTHRINSLEKQLTRIQKLSMSLWVAHEHSREFVCSMIRVFSPGYIADATDHGSSRSTALPQRTARAA